MTPLPYPLEEGGVVIWRLDQERFGPTWDSGEGAYQSGGRWNSKRRRVVYASLDPSTAILEVAAHIGFTALNAKPYLLTSAKLLDPSRVLVIAKEAIPNPHWLTPGAQSLAQQQFGDDLLERYDFIALPSSISQRSWNIIFDPFKVSKGYGLCSQERFALDPRLNPPSAN